MKFSMNLRSVSLAVAAAVLAGAAAAGARYSQPGVTVFKNADGSGQAYGTLGGTRNSAFPREKLSCTVSRALSANSAGAELKITTVVCTAIDKNGVSAVCTSSQEKFADALAGVANDGLIDFSFSSAGACTAITVYESSSLERKR